MKWIILLAVQLAAADWYVPVNPQVDPLAGCDTTLTTENGTFTSPGFPNNYANGLNCSWLIFLPPGKIIQLTFSSFLLEQNRDFVLAYDGPTMSYPVILNHTGYTNPLPAVSSTNTMLVRMITNPTIQYAGFRAVYEPIIATTTTTTMAPLPKCGGDLFGSGSFSPPVGPDDNYENYLNCTWLLQSSSPTKINIEFTGFQTELKVDYVKIWEGWSNSGNPLKTLTGQPPAADLTYVSGKINKLRIEFTSDADTGYPPFTAKFS